MSLHRRAVIGTVSLVLVAGCARKSPPAAGANVVTITATDYAFAAPDTVTAGLTTLRLVNHGKEAHHGVVIRIAAGTPQSSVDSALRTEGPIPPWMSFAAGPGAAMPADSTNATSVLEPGQYLLACFIPSPDGVPHVAKGMIRNLHVMEATAVGAAAAAAIAEPAADVVVTLSDYAFQPSQPLTAGTHTIRVENGGAQMHELVIERLAEGKSLADFMAWAGSGMQGPPPSHPVGGVTGPDVGKRAYTTVTLTPGRYLLLCYVPDSTDGRPHFVHGMAQEIRVS